MTTIKKTMSTVLLVAATSASLLVAAAPAHALFVPVVPLPAALAALTSLSSAVDPLDPDAYADRLVRAWGRGDRGGASAFATPEVISALVEYSSPGGRHWMRVASQGTAGTRFVTYRERDRGASLTLGVDTVSMYLGGGHLVYRVVFRPSFPPVARVSPTVYADLLVRAWGRGDRTVTADYGTTAVTARLFDHATPGGARWRRTDASVAADTTYVSYDNDAIGGHVVLAVANTAQWQGQRRAVFDLRFTP